MNKLNVLMATNILDIGGIDKHLQVFTDRLNKDIFSVSVLGIQQGGVREKILRDEGYEVFILQENLEMAEQMFCARKIDILHLHRVGRPERTISGLIRIAKKCGVPVIVEKNSLGEIDTSPEYQYIDKTFFISKMCYWRYLTRIKTLPDYQSRFTRSAVLYNPIEVDLIEKYILNEKEKLNEKQKLGIAPDKFVIGRIGRTQESKFSRILVEMLPDLLRKTKNFVFVSVGTPPEYKSMIKKMGLEKYCIFLNETAEPEKLYSLYCLFDVFVHSARLGESFGNVLAEAMACGVPVITNSTPYRDNAQIELVDHGVNGLVANYPKSYAEAVWYLLSNPDIRRKFGSAGQEKVKQLYEARKITRSLEKEYIYLIIKKGVKLEKNYQEYADTIEYLISENELQQFPQEYQIRLKNGLHHNFFLENLYILRNKFLEKLGPGY